MPRIPSLALGKKGTYQVHILGLYIYIYIYIKEEGIPNVPSSVLAQQNNHRIPDPGPTVRLVGTMAQDSVRKKRKEGKEKQCIKGEQANPHAIKKN